MKEGISVIICCFNSASRIVPTLHALQAQKEFNGPWELIIVDNNCTDNTVALAKGTWNSNPVAALQVVHEKQPGLMNARLRGLKSARYSIVSFIDDDNHAELLWLKKIDSIMKQHPDVVACGGRSNAVHESKPPSWFSAVETMFASGKQAESSGYLTHKDYLWGAGLTIRKKALDDLINSGYMFLLSGRSGTDLTGGEDGEICMALKLSGGKLWYENNLSLDHFIPASRLSLKKLEQMNFGFGRSWVLLDIFQSLLHPEKKIHTDWKQALNATKRTYLRTRIKLLLSASPQKKLRQRLYLNFLKGYIYQLKEIKEKREKVIMDLKSFFNKHK